MNDIHSRLKEQKEYLEKMGFIVAYIAVYGSQNYGMDTEESDLDMKAIVIPSLDRLIDDARRPISDCLSTPWGVCDLKDIRIFRDRICDGSTMYSEILYSDYYIASPEFEEIRAIRQEIAWKTCHEFFRSAEEFVDHLFKEMQIPFEEEFNENGYNLKELHHIARVLKLIEKFVPYNNEPVFTVTEEEMMPLLALKTAPMRTEYAYMQAQNLIESVKKVCMEKMAIWSQDYSIHTKMYELTSKIIKESILKTFVNKE